MMGRTYAGILGPLAFATVLFRGLILVHSADSTLKLAMFSLFAFAIMGFIIGEVAKATVLESVKARFDSEMQSRNVDKSTTPTS